jgi:hypothetical protein
VRTLKSDAMDIITISDAIAAVMLSVITVHDLMFTVLA